MIVTVFFYSSMIVIMLERFSKQMYMYDIQE